jgi:hypothetical protein
MRRGVLVRRVVVTVMAGALIIAAEVAATLSPAVGHPPSRQRPRPIVRPTSGGSEPGEPVLRSTSSDPRLAQSAAVTFVRDYALWSSRRVATMPGRDMTRHVLGLLEHRGRLGAVSVANAVASVRIARASRSAYVVTSAIGNFLVGKQRSRWLVISLPGD